jgi:tetratricopeptide (TPR) repeat protein
MATIEELVEAASGDMLNPEHNFNIAKAYEEIGQTAAAMSFYLRTAEYGYNTHPLLVYSSLIRISYCVEDQSGREHTLENSLFQAIQYMPARPEAYFVLSRYYEKNQKWQQCYTYAEIGLLYADNTDMLPVGVEYLGKYTLLFEKGVSAWWLGRKEESYKIFNDLLEQNIPEQYRSTIIYNLGLMDKK